MSDEPIEVERCLLSCILQSGDFVQALSAGVTERDFLLPDHSVIYEVMHRLHKWGDEVRWQDVNASTIGKVEAGYVLDVLRSYVPTPDNLKYYADQLVEQSCEMGRI